jgi:uncharacterized protein YjgD (DUF1641 family)
VNAAADVLFAAAVAYKTALAAHGEDAQGFEAAQAALKAVLSKSEEVRGAFESALNADDIRRLDGLLDKLLQSTASASAALDRCVSIAAANETQEFLARRRERAQAIEVDIDDV